MESNVGQFHTPEEYRVYSKKNPPAQFGSVGASFLFLI